VGSYIGRLQSPCMGIRTVYGKDTAKCFLLNKLHLLRRTQNKFIVFGPYIYATCFDHFSGHIQACQYNNHLKEDRVK